LLVALFRAVHEYGHEAVPRLLSPSADELPPELKSALAEITASSHPTTRELAERAVSDCIARLKTRSLERESTHIDSRLESCTEVAEKDALLERRQQIAAERSELWNQVHHM
jgi:hypothetical protein